jgi:hypothetical protein
MRDAHHQVARRLHGTCRGKLQTNEVGLCPLRPRWRSVRDGPTTGIRPRLCDLAATGELGLERLSAATRGDRMAVQGVHFRSTLHARSERGINPSASTRQQEDHGKSRDQKDQGNSLKRSTNDLKARHAR